LNNYKESYAPNKQQSQCCQQPNYKALIQDPTGQSQQLCVKDQQLKYQLDPTVNEVETFILRKVCSVEKKSSATSIKHTRTPYIFNRSTASFKHHSHTNRPKIGKISLTWKKLAKYPDTQASEYYRPQSRFTSSKTVE